MQRHLWISIALITAIVAAAIILAGCSNGIPVSVRNEDCDMGSVPVTAMLENKPTNEIRPKWGVNEGAFYIMVTPGRYLVEVPLGCQVEVFKARENDMTFLLATLYGPTELKFERHWEYGLVAQAMRPINTEPCP